MNQNLILDYETLISVCFFFLNRCFLSLDVLETSWENSIEWRKMESFKSRSDFTI